MMMCVCFSQHNLSMMVSPDSVISQGWDVSKFYLTKYFYRILGHYFWLLCNWKAHKLKSMLEYYDNHKLSCHVISNILTEYLTGILIRWIMYLPLYYFHSESYSGKLFSDQIIYDEFKLFPKYTTHPFLISTWQAKPHKCILIWQIRHPAIFLLLHMIHGAALTST